MGERGDIAKAINRALTARGEERALGNYILHGEQAQAPNIGRVIGKGLSRRTRRGHHSLILDGVDGRVRRVAARARVSAIVALSSVPAGSRSADRNMVDYAEAAGNYRPGLHRTTFEAGGVRMPGGDYEPYVQSHVRWLEALRRAGIV